MTSLEALNFLNQVAAQAAVPRATHAQAQQAVEILKKAITPKVQAPEAEAEPKNPKA
jgi:uncharacterized protein (UPF0147 family)